MASIIVVDDDPSIQTLFTRILEESGHRVRTASSLARFLEIMETETLDVVLLDVHLPDGRGEDVVPDVLARDPFLHVIVISGDLSLDTAVSATKKGAYDYLTKPFTADTLTHVVKQALEARRNMIERAATERDPLRAIRPQRRLAGSSPEICAVNLMIDRVSKTPATPVLVTGESGTGKELVAEAIHSLSSRRDRPLIKVNCSAIPRPLVEAELFGHERGAFTDAREPRKGLFELADGGTIFLDEIGDLELSIQPKLLRVLEEKTITRIGSEKPRRVDIRVVAATNRNLEQMCEENEFRDDLYFRLAVMRVEMPPLREHPEDIEKLAHLFLQEKSIELGKKVYGFSDEVLDFFRGYRWPGNVRELRNMVERLLILTDSDRIELDEHSLRRYCFQSDSRLRMAGSTTSAGPETSTDSAGSPRSAESEIEELADSGQLVTLSEVEKRYIRKALRDLDFNKTRAAKTLGISRSTLQRKISVYDLEGWIEKESGGRATD